MVELSCLKLFSFLFCKEISLYCTYKLNGDMLVGNVVKSLADRPISSLPKLLKDQKPVFDENRGVNG